MRNRVDNALTGWSLVLALAASAGLAEAQTAPPAKSAPATVAQVAKPGPQAQPPNPDEKTAKPEPTLAEILAQVSERHPDVLVAEARVREAEALLLQARLSVAQRAAASYQRQRIDKAKVADAEKHAAKHLISPEELSMAKAGLAIADAESPYAFMDSLGTEQFLKSGAGLRQQPLPASRAAVDPSKFPRGPAVDTVKRELNRQMTLDFDETPLADVVEFLRTTSGVTILFDSERGVEPDQPMKLALTEAPLGSALLAIEDLYRPLRFVVRDYGLLLTTEDAIGEDTLTLRDFWKLANDEAARAKR